MRLDFVTALLSAATTTAPLVSAYLVPRTHNTTTPALPSLLDADLEDLVTGLESGAFTSVDLVEAYEARILEVNQTLHLVGIRQHICWRVRGQVC